MGSYALLLHLPHLGTQAIDVTVLLAGLGFQWIVFKQKFFEFMRRIEICLLRLNTRRREQSSMTKVGSGINPRREQTETGVPSDSALPSL